MHAAAAVAASRRTFLSALPHVIEMAGGEVLMGCNSPIPIDPAAWRERLFNPVNSPCLGRPGTMAVWEELETVRPADPAPATPGSINRDLFPRDEFNSPDQ